MDIMYLPNAYFNTHNTEQKPVSRKGIPYCTLHTSRRAYCIVGQCKLPQTQGLSNWRPSDSRTARVLSGQVANLFSISLAFLKRSRVHHINISAKIESCGLAMLGSTVPSAIVASEKCPNRRHEELKN
jgi:hypothetical protein